MKKIINNPEILVDEMLEGLVNVYSDIMALVPGTRAIKRKDAPIKGKVAVITGGGSGHEPAHAGFVGPGMLTGAVAGDVFTAPSLEHTFELAKEVEGGKGIFFIIKNYAGDILMFETVMEMLRDEGIDSEKLIVHDDIAVPEKEGEIKRRGVAGTVLVHKIIGAGADEGLSLVRLKELGEKAVSSVRSFGMALSPCVIPARGEPNFTLGEDEIEIGIGIHGEPGVERSKIQDAHTLVTSMMDKLLGESVFSDAKSLLLMVNGMGATPLMELLVVFKEAFSYLNNLGIEVSYKMVGEYMTSLEMGGFSITLLKLDDELKHYIDYPTGAPAWRI